MGMSASQVRFLSLQHRKHNIGTQLTSLANKKMALSRDMNRVSKNYTNALNQKVLKWSNNSGVSYENLTYDMMMSPNKVNTSTPYIVTDAKTGKVVLNNDAIVTYDGKTLSDSDGAITYVKLAQMISTYSGINNKTNVLEFNTNGLTADGGSKAIDNAYYIPDVKSDFTFQNGLRYAIFKKLDLVSEAQEREQTSLLTALYGSEEAKDTGVYPVGSAMGDYYLALANLEAYDDYVNSQHYVVSSNSFGGSADAVAYGYDETEDYNYTSKMNGNKTGGELGTTITQTLKATSDALSRVNLNAIVGTTSDGFQTLLDSATNLDGYNSQKDAVFAKYNDSAQYLNADFSTSSTSIVDSFKMSLDQNGMTYEYNTTNLLDKVLSKCKNPYNSSSNPDEYYFIEDLKKALNDSYSYNDHDGDMNSTDTTANGLIKLNEYDGDYAYCWGKHNYTANTKNKLEKVLDAFKALLQSGAPERFNDNTAFKSAKNATVSFYMDNCKKYDNFYTTVVSATVRGDLYAAAERSATDMNAISTGSKKYTFEIFSGNWGNRSGMASYVDAKTLMNVFISYYNMYHTTGEVNNTVFDPNSIPDEGDDGSEGTEGGATLFRANTYSNIYSTTSDGDKLASSVVTYTNAGSDGLQRGIRYNVVLGQNGGSGIPLWISKSGSSWKTESDSSYNEYRITAYDEFVCKKSGSAYSAFTFTDSYGKPHDKLTNGNAICGVISQGSSFMFLDSTGMGEYMGGKSLSSIAAVHKEQFAPTTSTGNGSAGTKYDSSNIVNVDNDIVYNLQFTKGATSYFIGSKNEVEKNDEYRSYLESKVVEAQERISECKVDLENFYAAADSKMMDFYDALFQRIAENGWIIDDKTSVKSNPSNHAQYLNNKLQNNDFFISVPTERVDYTGFNYTMKQATSVTKIYEVRDESAENAALAEYETEKTLISSKERRIDMQMTKLETEQEAINTEMQSVKKVMTENIDKTFKIFA